MHEEGLQVRGGLWLFWLLMLCLLVAVHAHAQGNYEIQVYGADTIAPKTTMLELHSNFTAVGQTETIDGVYPTNHQQHETLEITQGINTGRKLASTSSPAFRMDTAGNGSATTSAHGCVCLIP